MDYQSIKKSVLAAGHKWYDEMMKLNIIFVRTDYEDTNTFKDKLYTCYISEIGKETVYETDVTTLPGWYWLLNPMNVDGTAIVKPGQYVDAYEIGKHYQQIALIQKGNIIVYRDNTKDKKIDLDNTYIGNNFCINIHHAEGIKKSVDKWSAGCFVFANSTHHAYFMFLCERQIKFTRKEKFTITLLMKNDII